MSCCGNKISSPTRQRQAAPAASAPSRRLQAAPRPAASPVMFEYVGRGAINVTGPLTGAAYKFTGPGNRVLVNAADAPSLLGVPGLRPAR